MRLLMHDLTLSVILQVHEVVDLSIKCKFGAPADLQII
jgi:hypothetical protein